MRDDTAAIREEIFEAKSAALHLIIQSDMAAVRSSTARIDPAASLDADRVRDLQLCSAADVGSLTEVAALIAAGANVNAVNERTLTPLMLSVENEQCVDVTRYLLEHGSHVNAAQIDTRVTAIHIAVKNNNIPAVRLLLRYGADLMALDCTKRSVMHWCALKGHTHLMMKLNRRTGGALLNAADDSGYTPLMLAAEHGRVSVVQALLQAGADPAVRNKLSHNAVELADWFGHKLVVDLLDVHAKVASIMPGGAARSAGAALATSSVPAIAAPPPAAAAEPAGAVAPASAAGDDV